MGSHDHLAIFILFYQYVVMNKNNCHLGVTARVLSAFNEHVLRLVTLCYLCARFEGEREGRENTQYDNGKVMGM